MEIYNHHCATLPFAAMDGLEAIRQLFHRIGLGEELSMLLSQVSICILVALLAWSANALIRRWLVSWLQEFASKTEATWDDAFVTHRVFERLSHLAPALILHVTAPSVFPHSPNLQLWARRMVLVYLGLVLAWTLHSMINAFTSILSEYESTRNRPLDSYAQLAKGVVWMFTGIFVLAELIGRSPWALIGGLGAFTAILLLVFRDAILGFVASVQMTTLDLVRKGDWIEMPKYGVDGTVVDFSLTTIKVQNFDRTISTVPTYAIISDTFKNWRGMSDSGGRRIKRSVYLDMYSVKFVDATLMQELQKIQYIQPYLKEKLEDIEQWNQSHQVDPTSLANGRRITNIGTFRAYLSAYLRNHPSISQTMTFLVRQLPPDPHGIGLELYVFSTEQRWAYYEGIIADIFDHILAILPIFELRVFQHPTGADVRAVGLSFSQPPPSQH